MHTLGRYATLATTYILVLGRKICFSLGGKMLHKVESMMMILLSEFFASLSPPSSGGLTIILCSSLTHTYNKNLGTNCGPI